MKTEEKYKEMGFTKIGNGAVQDRHGDIYFPKKAKSPQKAIKLFCRECMGMDRRKQENIIGVEMVRECTDPVCPLFDFRMGKNPFRANSMTEDQKRAAGARLALASGRGVNSAAGDQISTAGV
jgi:hypothetical protein